MTDLSSIRAAAVAIASQVTALVIGFGIVDNTTAGVIGALSVAVVNAAFLIAHAIHANAAAKVTAAAASVPPPVSGPLPPDPTV